MKKKGLIALELDSQLLKVMTGQVVLDGWQVDSCEIRKIADLPEEELITLLKELLPAKKIKASKVLMLVPRSLVTVKYLNLPATSADELQSMVDFQAGRQIPYNPDEIIYDYQVLGPIQNGYARVLLAIVRRELVLRYLDLLDRAGIRLERLELSSLALVQAYGYVNQLQQAEDKKLPQDVPVALIDVDYTSTDIVVIQNGVSLFTRALSIGTKQLEKSQDEWLDEITRSLTVFAREQKQKVAQIVVPGDGAGKISGLLKQRVAIPAVSCDIEPLVKGVSFQDGAIAAEGIHVSIAGLLGLLREGTATTVNLIPQSVRHSWLVKQQRKSLVLSGLLLVGIIAVLGLTLNKKIADRKTYLGYLQQRVNKTEPSAKELAIKKERLALIKNQLSVERTSLDVLRELYQIIPPKTSINVFIYDDKLGVTIKGTSPAMSEVFALIPKLEESVYFENVTSRYATRRKIKGQELVDFHIDCLTEKTGSLETEEEGGES